MPRRYDWFFKEVFLILSAPIFWALLTNFDVYGDFIDDRYYHKEAKQYRKDKRDAKRLHFELTGHYEYYHYHLSDRAEDFCAAFLKKLGCCKDKLKKRKKKGNEKRIIIIIIIINRAFHHVVLLVAGRSKQHLLKQRKVSTKIETI